MRGHGVVYTSSGLQPNKRGESKRRLLSRKHTTVGRWNTPGVQHSGVCLPEESWHPTRKGKRIYWKIIIVPLAISLISTWLSFIHPLPGNDVHQQWISDKTASLRKADVSPRSSSLRDVSRGGTSVTQWWKFHTDDVNQCLHNKSGSHGVPNVNLFDFTFLLVDFGKVLCSSVNKLQQNSNASC